MTIHEIVQSGNVGMLKEAPVTPQMLSERDKYGMQPLHLAVILGLAEMVVGLIDLGADVLAKVTDGPPPECDSGVDDLFVALGKKDFKGAGELLSDGVNPNRLLKATRGNLLETILSLSKRNGDFDKRRRFLQHAHDCCLFLLKREANPNAKDISGTTPFFFVLKDNTDSLRTFQRLLEKHGGDPLVPQGFGSTALHLAATYKWPEIAELLLDKGVPPDVPDDIGQTALHRAAASNSEQIASLLISRGAHVNRKTVLGFTPLHFAVQEESLETAFQIIHHGGDITATWCDLQSSLLEVAALTRNGLMFHLLKTALQKKDNPPFSSILKEMERVCAKAT